MTTYWDHPNAQPSTPPVPVDMGVLCETIGWDALVFMISGPLSVVRAGDDEPAGFRFSLEDHFWMTCTHTGDGRFSCGLMYQMVPQVWAHDVPLAGLRDKLMEMCVDAVRDP